MPNPKVDLLARALAENGIDAYFGWSEVSLGYLYGHHEHAGHRFLALGVSATGETAFICPALSATQAARSGIPNIRSWVDGTDPLALFEALAEEWNLRGAVIGVDEDLPALHLLRMQASLPAALFKDGGPVLNGLRRKKTDAELALLTAAAKIADDSYPAIKAQIKIGMTELELARIVYDEMTKRGGNPNFAIMATGANGAEPHHANDATPIEEGDVLILDFGCDVEGYRSDITRTVAVGHATPEAHAIYELVYQAHMAGRKAGRAGVTVGSVDKAARDVIEAGGYGPQFMHRLGHGIGLQGHEMPYIIPGGDDILAVGDCYSIEPGIYLPGKFGVRIENIVHAEEGSSPSFNVEPSPVLEIVPG